MSNAIATINTSFSITRVSKSGKESTRGLLGLIVEGTPAERLATGTALVKEAWENGTLKTVLVELQRVFNGSMFTAATIFCKLDMANPTKPEMINLMDNLARINADSKGVKAKYVVLMNELIKWSEGEADRKAARKAAYEASLLEANTVETK